MLPDQVVDQICDAIVSGEGRPRTPLFGRIEKFHQRLVVRRGSKPGMTPGPSHSRQKAAMLLEDACLGLGVAVPVRPGTSETPQPHPPLMTTGSNAPRRFAEDLLRSGQFWAARQPAAGSLSPSAIDAAASM